MKKKLNLGATFKLLKKAWPYARKYKKYIFLFMLLSVFLAAISVIVPIYSAQLILNITDGILGKVLVVAVTIFILEIFRNIVNYFTNQCAEKFYINSINDVQLDLAKETLDLEVKEIDAHSSGVFVDRLTKDADSISNVFNDVIFNISAILKNIGVLGAVFIVCKPMFIFYVLSIVLIYLFDKCRMSSWYRISKEQRQLDENNSGLISELVRGIRDIKVLNSANDFMKKIINKISTANHKSYELYTNQRRWNLLTGSCKDLVDLLFIVFGVYLVHVGSLTIDNFVIIYMYRSQISNLSSNISLLIERLKEFDLSATRVFDIINGNFKKEKFGTKHLAKINGDFEFKNVTFGYDDKKEILKDLSFKVNANETVAFVGKSGGGKTTIFSLIDKLYTAGSGEITIDGVNINELDKDSIRDNITIITQNPYIFNFTIKENLKLIKSDATDEEIEEACKIARLHDYIMSLPDKYDTLIGEGGVNLSGGQRQRLAIARALLKKTEIILFDEATSALDNKTQREIQEAINSMKGEYTILIIAHRLSTVIDSDRIIFINDGKVVAEGTHKELLSSNEMYKQLYKKELL